VRRAQWVALGIPPEDFEKPKIAIINTSSDLSICFSHLDGVISHLKDGVRQAGGLPFEIRTTAPSDFIHAASKGARYILPSRDLIANDIEVSVEGPLLDGMICLASCDKTTPGQLMAAARLNIPTIFVICGYQDHGEFEGRKVDIEEVFESVGKVATKEITLEQLTGMADASIQSPGVCPGMGTANSMHIVCEALGMCLPGHAPVRANSHRMIDHATRAAGRVVEMVEEDLRPRDIMTAAAFRNATRAVLASSCSVNTVRHLQAVADEAELDINMYELVEELGPKVPLLVAVRPNGDTRVEELEASGGALGIMAELAKELDEAVTVSGRALSDVLTSFKRPKHSVIKPTSEPLSRQPALVTLYGNLAPEGALMKLGTGGGNKMQFSGPAKIFHSQEDAIAAIGKGEIVKGDVAVLRYLGPRGGPGLAFASWFVAALNGAGLGDDVAVVTDGQLSGLNRGIAINQVAPEAFERGPLALLEEGDVIEIDVAARRLSMVVDDESLERRLEGLPEWRPAKERGWLSVFQRLAKPIHKGAALTPED
jgi:dihydroxy-acid dehydratase